MSSYDESNRILNEIMEALEKPMNRTAVIFGVTGQDGFYLSKYLLGLGYYVVGVPRRSSVDSHTERLSSIINHQNFSLIEGDVSDASSVTSIIRSTVPDEVYNLAAQSHVHTSFEQPSYTFSVNALGVLNILEAIRHFSYGARFYQASTSEMFGNNVGNIFTCGTAEEPNRAMYRQDEQTAFDPSSPYAISKVAAHNMCKLYRSSYNLFVCCGILFNHESPIRGKNFVTRKITRYVAALHNFRDQHWTVGNCPMPPKLRLGNLYACRDWGFAGDYVKAMHMMLQHDKPDDYVVATGETHSVADFCRCAFASIGIENWGAFVEVDHQFVRPRDVPYLLGDARKIKKTLGWEPETNLDQLVEMMVMADIDNGEQF